METHKFDIIKDAKRYNLVINIAHTIGNGRHNEDGTPCVSNIPLGTDNEPLDPVAGHGLWKPDNPIYDYLLSTPNIKPIAHMLADHCTEMDNPYIVEIHTFPAIRGWALSKAKREDERDAAIVLVLGPMPSVTGCLTGPAPETIATA